MLDSDAVNQWTVLAVAVLLVGAVAGAFALPAVWSAVSDGTDAVAGDDSAGGDSGTGRETQTAAVDESGEREDSTDDGEQRAENAGEGGTERADTGQQAATAWNPTPEPVDGAVLLEERFGNLSRWETDTYGADSGRVAVTDGAANLSVVQCHTAVATTTLEDVEGPVRVSFDWRTVATDWWERTDWQLRTADGTNVSYWVVEGTDLSRPDRASTKQGSVTARANASGTLTLRLLVYPSRHCDNYNHGRTTMLVDNLVVIETGD